MTRRTKEKIATSASRAATQASGGAHLTLQEAQVAWTFQSSSQRFLTVTSLQCIGELFDRFTDIYTKRCIESCALGSSIVVCVVGKGQCALHNIVIPALFNI